MSLQGSTNEEKIWNYLMSKLNNAFGVAGLMGNIQAESGLNPKNLQNSYEKKLGYTDETYTSAVDKKTYTNFVYDKAGYGLVQWTYWSLKQALYNYVVSKGASIGDLETQLEFLCKQLSESYKPIWQTLQSTSSVLEASNAVLLKFERPADQSTAVQTKRAGYGQVFYNKYATKTTVTSQASSSTLKIGLVTMDENGKVTGGASEGKLLVTTWYNRPWTKVFRPIESTTKEKIATAMEQACANSNIKYDKFQRTLFNEAKSKSWNLTNITNTCYTDACGLIAVCAQAAGLSTIPQTLTTSNLELLFNRTGKFSTLNTSLILSGTDYLMRGDILFASGMVCIVLSNGSKVTETVTSISKDTIGTATALATMNVRTGAGTNYQVVGTLASGSTVQVLAITSTGWYKIIYDKAAAGYAYVSNSNNKYFKYTPLATSTTTVTPQVVNYLVKVTADVLNVRKGPGTNYAVATTIKDHGVYTIIKEQSNWGYLKSGAGWIDLNNTQRK